MVKLKDIGEHKLLEIINQYCDRTKNGDDAAILDLSKGKQLVVTTDILVEDVHFSDRTTPPIAVGYRAVTANLSDIAAMGAMPIGITVGLSLREDTQLSWIEAIYQGMQKCLQPYKIAIVGGDVTKSKINTIAITALGEVDSKKIIYRHSAKVGDLILITGNHGLSRAGLELLLYPDKYEHISSEIKKKAIKAHQYPQPRLDAIKCLHKYFPDLSSTAGMDSSDGLADAIIKICQQSKVGAKINLQQIKIAKEIMQITDDKTALDWVFYGGEDFELVLCINEKIAYRLQQYLGGDSQIIGEITSYPKIKIINHQNHHLKLLLNQEKTFQHF